MKDEHLKFGARTVCMYSKSSHTGVQVLTVRVSFSSPHTTTHTHTHNLRIPDRHETETAVECCVPSVAMFVSRVESSDNPGDANIWKMDGSNTNTLAI